MRRMILVDDEPNVLSSLKRLLARSLPLRDVHVDVCPDPMLALTLARRAVYDVVVSDYRMPQMNGVEFLSRWKEIQPDSIRIVLSASTDFEAVQGAINQADAFKYLIKPWSDEAILTTLGEAFSKHDEIAITKSLAQAHLQSEGKLSAEELEIQRLEAIEPGITKVRWDTDGSVLLDDI